MPNTESEAWPKTVEEAVSILVTKITDEEDRRFLRGLSDDGLLIEHHNLGRAIRNNFGLWQGNAALLRDAGFDPDEVEPHEAADGASHIILIALRNRLISILDAPMLSGQSRRPLPADPITGDEPRIGGKENLHEA